MTTYILLTADLQPATTDHEIVRIEHPLLAQPLLVSAHFAPDAVTWEDAKAWAEKLTLGGLSWRLPTVEEGFFIPNHSKFPAWDPTVFVGARDRYPWIWTSTPDAEEPAGFAWYVFLDFGFSYRDPQVLHDLALAVCAGQ